MYCSNESSDVLKWMSWMKPFLSVPFPSSLVLSQYLTPPQTSSMPSLNRYTPPPPLSISDYHASTSLEEYDLNWCYTSIPPSLQTEGGVKLVPLIVRSTLSLPQFPLWRENAENSTKFRTQSSLRYTLQDSTNSIPHPQLKMIINIYLMDLLRVIPNSWRNLNWRERIRIRCCLWFMIWDWSLMMGMRVRVGSRGLLGLSELKKVGEGIEWLRLGKASFSLSLSLSYSPMS